MLPIRIILHPTDFSKRSEMAFQFACVLARDHGSKLVVMHVVPPPADAAEERARQPPDSYYDQLMNEYLLPIKSPYPEVNVEHRLVEGEPQKEIVRVASELPADLVIMGTHGRTGLHRLLMGSVAEEVLRLAPCPVVTIKLPFGDTVATAEAPKK